jgi:hypothetical protein
MSNLRDFLTKTAKVQVTPEPAKTAAPAPAPVAAPAPAAAPAAAPVVAKVAAAPAAAPAPVAAPAPTKTAAQAWLSEHQGIEVKDPAKAEALVGTFKFAQEQQKVAAMQAYDAEQSAIGALQYHGMLKESMAMAIADGTASKLDVVKTAAWTGTSVQALVARANELTKIAELAAASAGEAFFMGQRGAGGRMEGQGAVGRAAQVQSNLQEWTSEASSGTRAASRGIDGAELGFQDTVTLPNNPGLNHGQKTENGKA